MNSVKNKQMNTIFIGDNLDVMHSKSFSVYKNNVKMIYIDPPYNTKSIKAYNDNFDSIDWIQFMEPRIKLSREFLMDNGCIFISIDDNEYVSLKSICDKVYGKNNFVGSFITYQALRSNSKHINTIHEYVLCYAKNKRLLKEFKIKRIDKPEERIIIDSVYKDINKIIQKDGIGIAKKQIKNIILDYCRKYNISWLKNYNNLDDEGKIYFAMDLSTPSEPREVSIKSINLYLKPLKTRGWTSDERLIDLYNRNLLVFKGDRPYEKHYLEDACDNVVSILRFFSRNGTNDLKKLDLNNIFDTPKPVELIKFLIKIASDENDLIMDFFAGSGTTAQAVYEVNKERNSNNNYILIQLPESINKKTVVYKECVKNGIEPVVSSILQYRLKRYLEQNNKTIDYKLISIS